jgi:hypothetical protein
VSYSIRILVSHIPESAEVVLKKEKYQIGCVKDCSWLGKPLNGELIDLGVIDYQMLQKKISEGEQIKMSEVKWAISCQVKKVQRENPVFIYTWDIEVNFYYSILI